jgi:diguanylate cyclase (GGDEF)-like protein/PAS domain S-box-containing protein
MNINSNNDDQTYLKALSVLYVEDEEAIREEMDVFLQRRLKKVYTAVNGRAGLDAFAKYHPDLVISDIRMPVMDGLAMVERIRAVNLKIPVIITTAFEESSYFQKSIDLGVDKYVVKPIKFDILDNALQKCARLIRSEAALIEVNERYRLLFQLSHIAISISDTGGSTEPNVLVMNGRIVDCNEAFIKLLGFDSQDEISKLLFSDLLMPEAISQVNKLMREELLVRGFSHEAKLKLRGKVEGQVVPVIVQFIVRRDEQGVAEEIWAVMRDISEQEKAEKALLLAECVFNNSNEGMLVTDSDNRIISVNPAFSVLTGYSQDEVLGQNPNMLKSGENDQFFYQQLWSSLQTNGFWKGEIMNRRKSGEVFPEWLSIRAVLGYDGSVVNYIGIFSDISEFKHATERVEFLAHYDPLTELVNRNLLEQLVDQAILMAARNKTQLALLFIDLDRFKLINDTLGHTTGDLVLKVVAKRLRKMTREVDIVARLSGDEFIIVLSGIAGGSDVIVVARKLIAILEAPIKINGKHLIVTSSMGISLYPENGVTYGDLLKNADTAMYRAKKSGTNKFLFFTTDMNCSLEEMLLMQNALRRALKVGEFELYYQPQVNLHSRQIIGMEALLRWHSAEFGTISPATFIPMAEEIGLIVVIGEWVLREACRQNAEWQRQGLLSVVVAVNLSAIQFRQKDLKETVLSALQDSSLAPEYLELELTESIVMQDVDSAIVQLRDLKKLGIKLSVDDFGTGYSSLAYLKRFPIDKLKIDQSFIRDLVSDSDDEKIVKAIIGLAQAMNLKVIAEGVETREQFTFLRDHQCDEMQGYWFSKPLPVTKMMKLLKQAGIPRDLT